MGMESYAEALLRAGTKVDLKSDTKLPTKVSGPQPPHIPLPGLALPKKGFVIVRFVSGS
jgi:hypothetical protein